MDYSCDPPAVAPHRVLDYWGIRSHDRRGTSTQGIDIPRSCSCAEPHNIIGLHDPRQFVRLFDGETVVTRLIQPAGEHRPVVESYLNGGKRPLVGNVSHHRDDDTL